MRYTIFSGDDDGGEEDDDEMDEKLPSCMDYVMHFLSLFWKVLFACVPPTGKQHFRTCFLSESMTAFM